MDEVTYSEVRTALSEAHSDHSAPEIHGLVSGWICAGAGWDHRNRLDAVKEYLDIRITPPLESVLDRLYIDASASLNDEEFGFQLLLPSDAEPLNTRTKAVSDWCQGFLSGFGMTGRYSDKELSADLQELFQDLARIAAVSAEVPEDDENEVDLVEIIEYVRMSALLVLTECTRSAVH